jgi:hypothetical protein
LGRALHLGAAVRRQSQDQRLYFEKGRHVLARPTESQFESYRALGYEIAYKILCYAERERLVGAAATEAEANVIAAQPIDNFNIGVSTLTLDGIVERLHANLQRTA